MLSSTQNVTGTSGCGDLAAVDVERWALELLRRLEPRVLHELGVVVVNRARDDVDVQALGALGLGYMYKREALGLAVASHSSRLRPLPFDLEIFSPFSSRNSS